MQNVSILSTIYSMCYCSLMYKFYLFWYISWMHCMYIFYLTNLIINFVLTIISEKTFVDLGYIFPTFGSESKYRKGRNGSQWKGVNLYVFVPPNRISRLETMLYRIFLPLRKTGAPWKVWLGWGRVWQIICPAFLFYYCYISM